MKISIRFGMMVKRSGYHQSNNLNAIPECQTYSLAKLSKVPNCKFGTPPLLNLESTDLKSNKLLVIGVGNTLREDDGVGIYLLYRLKEYFSFQLNALEVYQPDVMLAEKIAAFEHLLIIDAMLPEDDAPYKLIPLKPVKRFISSGFVTHIFDWDIILAIAKEFFGKAPFTELLGVSAFQFSFSESLSPRCKANAEKALDFLVQYCLDKQ